MFRIYYGMFLHLKSESLRNCHVNWLNIKLNCYLKKDYTPPPPAEEEVDIEYHFSQVICTPRDDFRRKNLDFLESPHVKIHPASSINITLFSITMPFPICHDIISVYFNSKWVINKMTPFIFKEEKYQLGSNVRI